MNESADLRIKSTDGPTSAARFELSKVETTYIFASFLLSGRWEDLSVSEEEAREWVWQFVGGMNDHGSKVVKGLFVAMRNTLMAHRKDSFVRIQQEPFFSAFSLRNTMQLDAAWTAAGDDGFH